VLVFTKSLAMQTKLHHLVFLKKTKKQQRKPLAMKLNAIFNSGKGQNDFVDMHSLLEKFSLFELLVA